MKKEFLLNLDSFTDVENFCMELIEKIPCDVDALYNSRIIDAKSYLGLISISFQPVVVRINSDDKDIIDKFTEICNRYEFN